MKSINKKVSSIDFGVISPKLIQKIAPVKIITPELYDKEGYPVDGGLMDVRLGVIDPGLRCKTCGGRLKECFGHFGYLELARPIVHYKYISIILSLLKATCRQCSAPLLNNTNINKFKAELEATSSLEGKVKKAKAILTFAAKNSKKCPHCNVKVKEIKLEKPTTILEEGRRIGPVEIRTRLEKIRDEDLEIFGFDPSRFRPEWVILTLFLIPPVTMRPSITLETGERSEDDLTHKLGDIVRINQRLFENINAGAPEVIVEDLWDLLQYHVTTYFDNNISQVPPARHRSGSPLKTLTERIKSKDGRFRYNLVGKRTNFSSRTVISPDPRIEINEVGVPFVIAKYLTVPERVTEWNIERLKKFIKRGPKKYPGANYIIRPDGRRKKITDDVKEQIIEELQQGYIVERHLMDGDIALFNRQPSLHRMSIMGHKIKVLPYKTFRLNPAITKPYNADFDGDEMNLHIPQTEEAKAEAEVLMQVPTQLISPRYGLCVIGGSQDSLSGNYILTKNKVYSKAEAMQLLAFAGVDTFDKIKNIGTKSITGKQIFSCLIPDDFNFNSKYIKIVNGQLIEGVIDKNSLGAGQGILLRTLHKNYGEEFTVDFLSKAVKLGIVVLLKEGFSISLSEMDIPNSAKNKIKSSLEQAEQEVAKVIKLYEKEKLESYPGKTLEETVEIKILELLNNARNQAGKIVSEHAKESNQIIIMADSGAAGKLLNLAQITSLVGQQALRGKRINKGYKLRTLSMFKKRELSPKSRGFVKSSFKSGLDPAEFFFGAMTGRDSLMDTALRTPKSGYLYRRLANALQDIKVNPNGVVKDASGTIIEFDYGEDGIDVSKSEKGSIDVNKIGENL